MEHPDENAHEADEVCLLFHETQRRHLTDVLIEMKDSGILCCVKELTHIGEPDSENTLFLSTYGVVFTPYVNDQMYGVFSYVGRPGTQVDKASIDLTSSSSSSFSTTTIITPLSV